MPREVFCILSVYISTEIKDARKREKVYLYMALSMLAVYFSVLHFVVLLTEQTPKSHSIFKIKIRVDPYYAGPTWP